jgi:hypothetical protein
MHCKKIMDIFTEEEEIKKVDFGRPHCFLLGAGASLAAFPNGERNGKKLPVMANFIEVLELEPILNKAGYSPPYGNFEEIYAELSSRPEHNEIVAELENQIYQYFEGMELPDEPTLYDHLILSLREKDVIATFNWDPFLFQAAARNNHLKQPPKMFFLHGSVAIGVCHNCRLKVHAYARCPKCGEKTQQSRILYPVTEKNYTDDPFINSEWGAFKHYLSQGYIFTIFGYGAPVSDVEAVKLLSEAWGDPEDKSLEEIEILDVLSKEELGRRWDRFIHTHHYRTPANFYESMASRHPRRSCEALWESLMMCRPSEEKVEISKEASFQELYEFIIPRIEVENA